MPKKKKYVPPPPAKEPSEYDQIVNNMMSPDDTFRFSCSMCGNCCRNRREPIIITGLDVFCLAKGLGIPPVEVIQQYMRPKMGHSSHLPMFLLKERPDRSCKFLRNGACMVHSFKPIVCAVFPLGQAIDSRDGNIMYFRQPVAERCGGKDGRVWTLKEWIESCGLNQLDQESVSWSRISTIAALGLQKVRPEQLIDGKILLFLMEVMFVDYDPKKDFVSQVANHIEKIKEMFWEGYHKLKSSGNEKNEAGRRPAFNVLI